MTKMPQASSYPVHSLWGRGSLRSLQGPYQTEEGWQSLRSHWGA
jgi:hypothetical protein